MVRPWRVLSALAVLWLLLTSPLAPADDSGLWAGQRVMTRKPGVRLSTIDENKQRVYHGRVKDIILGVLKDENGWLKVRQGGMEAWFPKEEAVLLDDAIPYFTTRIRADANDDYAYAHRGSAWAEKGKLDNALDDYNEAVRLQSDEAVWHNNRGHIYEQKQELDRALADYIEAIRLDPKYAVPYNNRANISYRKKENVRALADYDEAIRIDPNYALAYRNRAHFHHHERRDFAKAIADLTEALRIEPDDHVSQNAKAWLRAVCPDAKHRNGKEALALARRACEQTRWKVPHCLGTLAAAYAELGQFDEAVRWQSKALESPAYQKEYGEAARKCLELYKARKPYREG